MATLVYYPGCPNCTRFIDALGRAKGADVRLVNISDLSKQQRAGITAVPTLLLPGGQKLTGTQAFEYLDKFRGDPDPFFGFSDLTFSDVGGIGYAEVPDYTSSV